MKLKEFNKCGFFYEEDDKDILYEVFENNDFIEDFDSLPAEDQEKLYEEKLRPDCKFFVDVWHYDYKDLAGIKHYDVDGTLYTMADYGELEVIEDKNKYRLLETQINSGCFLVEDKLTYKERLDKIQSLCEKASNKSTFCNGVENKDMQKLAIKILKIIHN